MEIKKQLLCLLATAGIIAVPASAFATTTLPTATKNSIVRTSTVIDGETVNYVTINTHDPKVSVSPVVANNRFGTTSSLASMAKSAHAVVAINGTFFNSWSNNYPSGAIEINGQFQNESGGTILGFGTKGQLLMSRAKESVTATINDDSSTISNLWPWFLNSPNSNANRVSILTPYFGNTTKDKNASVVDIVGEKVMSIHQGITNIPSNGYAVELGSGESTMLNRIHEGDRASLSVTVNDLNGNPMDFLSYPNAVAAGPMLVNNSKIVLNPGIEGFTDPTLIKPNTQRSFAGIDNKGDLVLGTIHSATLATEADITKKIGLKQAMNLDGGSSTGLYINGAYITAPGRSLATAIVVTYK